MGRGTRSGGRALGARPALGKRPTGTPATSEQKAAADKKARRDARIKKRIDEMHSRIDTGIEAIRTDEGMRDYLQKLSKFYRYSASNVMLIHSQFPGAVKVASETQWKKLGRELNDGESRNPIRILAPTFFVKTETDDDTGEERKVRVMSHHRFTTANVYDISQTSGDDSLDEGDVSELSGETEEATAMANAIAKWCDRNGVRYRATSGVANGSAYQGDEITIDRELPQQQRVLLFATEVARAVMDKDAASFAKLSVHERELAVQASAYAVANAAGMDAADATFPALKKLASGAGQLRGDARKSVDRALKATQKITRAVLEVPQPAAARS